METLGCQTIWVFKMWQKVVTKGQCKDSCEAVQAECCRNFNLSCSHNIQIISRDRIKWKWHFSENWNICHCSHECHEGIHTKGRKKGKFACKICDKTFRKSANLTLHKKKDHPEQREAKPVSHQIDANEDCDIKMISVKRSKQGESKSQDPKPEVSFVCKTYGDHFNYPSELQSHQLKHFMEQPFGCR